MGQRPASAARPTVVISRRVSPEVRVLSIVFAASTLAFAKKPVVVTPTFAWEPGTATVTSLHVLSATNTGLPDDVLTTRSVDHLEIQQLDSGYRLIYATVEEAVAHTRGGVGLPEDPVMAAFRQALEAVPLDIQVGPHGEFLGPTDPTGLDAGISSAVNGVIADLLARAPDEDSRARAAAGFEPLRRIATGATAVGQLQKDWTWETSYWNRANIEIGHTYTGHAVSTHPLTGAPMHFDVQFTSTAVERCRNGGHAPMCLALDVTVTALRDELLTMVRDQIPAFLGGRPAPEGLAVLDGSYTEHRVGLVEIETLRPWQWSTDTVSWAKMGVGDDIGTHEQRNHEETRWEWDD